MKRKILSLILVAAMVLTFIPSAFAAELTITAANGTGGAVILTITTSASYTADDPLYYKVFTEQQWNDAGMTWDGQDGKTVTGVSTAGDATTVNIASEFGADGKYYVACYDDTSGSGSAEVLPLDIEGKQIKVPKSTITWNLNYTGSTNPTTDQAQGAVVTLPTNPTRTGYTFGGWFKEAGCTTALPSTETVPTSDVSYYAKWTANELSMDDSEVSVTYGDASINAELKKATNGTGTYTYTTTDTLPTGLLLNAAGKITGTANAATAAAGVEITVTATDDNSAKTTTAKVTIKVAKATPVVKLPAEADITAETTLEEVAAAVTVTGVNNTALDKTGFKFVDKDGNELDAAALKETVVPNQDYYYIYSPVAPADDNYNAIPKTTKKLIGQPVVPHNAYIKGYKNADGTVTHFGPDDSMTRAQAITILARLSGWVDGQKTEVSNMFSDVKAKDAAGNDIWYYDAVCYAKAHKLVNGFTDGTFKPDQAITRGEFAAMLARYFLDGDDKVDPNGKCTKFADAKGDPYEKYVAVLEQFEGIKGFREDGTFRTGAEITRAQAVTMVNAVEDRAQPTDDTTKLNFADPFQDVHKAQWFFNNIIEAVNDHAKTDAPYAHN